MKPSAAACALAERVALHEAGHAISALDLRHRVVLVGLTVWSETRMEGRCLVSDEHAPLDEVLATKAAGQVAEVVAGYRGVASLQGRSSDAVAFRGVPRAQKLEAVGLAESILRRRWADVEAVAHRLMAGIRERGHACLSRAEIDAAVAEVTP